RQIYGFSLSSNSASIYTKSTGTNRLNWVEYAKGIAIILVVYRHILIGIRRSGLDVSPILVNANEIVYSFRMPLFFVLSGIFAAKSILKRTPTGFTQNKLRTIMYPYLIWGIIQISIQILLTDYTNANRSIIDFLYLLVHPRAIDQLWYLYALFNVSILFMLLFRVVKLNNLLLVIIALLCYGASTFVKQYSLIHDTMYYLIFFVVGHIGSKYLLNPKYYYFYNSYKPFILLFPLFWLTQWYWLLNRDMNIFLFGIIALLGTAFVFSLSFILAKKESIVLKPIQIAGKYSLQIYLMHLLVVSAIRIFMVRVLKMEEPIIILSVGWILGCVLPVVAYKIMKPTFLNILFEPQLKK
ncbi:MAG: acyltransferase, partial [Bacteroidota bacterium]